MTDNKLNDSTEFVGRVARLEEGYDIVRSEIHAVRSEIRAMVDNIKALSQETTTAFTGLQKDLSLNNKTDWGVLAAFCGVAISIVSVLNYLTLRPIYQDISNLQQINSVMESKLDSHFSQDGHPTMVAKLTSLSEILNGDIDDLHSDIDSMRDRLRIEIDSGDKMVRDSLIDKINKLENQLDVLYKLQIQVAKLEEKTK